MPWLEHGVVCAASVVPFMPLRAASHPPSSARITDMLVRDRMSAHPVTVRSDADYKAALMLMQEHALHHVPVLDAGRKLVGIVAERDLLLAATRHLQSAIEVADVMRENVTVARPDMPIAEAATLMVELRIGALPVIDGNEHVIGVITETDIFRAFVERERNTGADAAGA
jgi:acetoin utilization protein AcuB